MWNITGIQFHGEQEKVIDFSDVAVLLAASIHNYNLTTKNAGWCDFLYDENIEVWVMGSQQKK